MLLDVAFCALAHCEDTDINHVILPRHAHSLQEFLLPGSSKAFLDCNLDFFLCSYYARSVVLSRVTHNGILSQLQSQKTPKNPQCYTRNNIGHKKMQKTQLFVAYQGQEEDIHHQPDEQIC